MSEFTELRLKIRKLSIGICVFIAFSYILKYIWNYMGLPFISIKESLCIIALINYFTRRRQNYDKEN